MPFSRSQPVPGGYVVKDAVPVDRRAPSGRRRARPRRRSRGPAAPTATRTRSRRLGFELEDLVAAGRPARCGTRGSRPTPSGGGSPARSSSNVSIGLPRRPGRSVGEQAVDDLGCGRGLRSDSDGAPLHRTSSSVLVCTIWYMYHTVHVRPEVKRPTARGRARRDRLLRDGDRVRRRARPRRPQPAEARRRDRHEPPHAHLPLRLEGRPRSSR